MTEENYRGIYEFVINGHYMYRMSEEEMGGGFSGFTIGCYTCRPEDGVSAIAGYSIWDWPGQKVYTINEALLQSRKDMWKHAHPERQKDD